MQTRSDNQKVKEMQQKNPYFEVCLKLHKLQKKFAVAI